MPGPIHRRRDPVGRFDPSKLAGLQLWYKADTGLYQDSALTTPAAADADPVGGWKDQSGNARHATQATAAKRPLYKVGIQNGRPGVLFDRVDDFISTPLNQTTLGAITVFAVATDTSGSGVFRYLMGVATTDRYGLALNTADKVRWTVRDNGAAIRVDLIWATVVAGVKVMVATYTPTIGTLQVNGGAPQTSSPAGFVLSATSVTIDLGWVGALYWGGYLHEFGLYNAAVGTADANRLRDYLNRGWRVY